MDHPRRTELGPHGRAGSSEPRAGRQPGAVHPRNAAGGQGSRELHAFRHAKPARRLRRQENAFEGLPEQIRRIALHGDPAQRVGVYPAQKVSDRLILRQENDRRDDGFAGKMKWRLEFGKMVAGVQISCDTRCFFHFL